VVTGSRQGFNTDSGSKGQEKEEGGGGEARLRHPEKGKGQPSRLKYHRRTHHQRALKEGEITNGEKRFHLRFFRKNGRLEGQKRGGSDIEII